MASQFFDSLTSIFSRVSKGFNVVKNYLSSENGMPKNNDIDLDLKESRTNVGEAHIKQYEPSIVSYNNKPSNIRQFLNRETRSNLPSTINKIAEDSKLQSASINLKFNPNGKLKKQVSYHFKHDGKSSLNESISSIDAKLPNEITSVNTDNISKDISLHRHKAKKLRTKEFKVNKELDTSIEITPDNILNNKFTGNKKINDTTITNNMNDSYLNKKRYNDNENLLNIVDKDNSKKLNDASLIRFNTFGSQPQYEKNDTTMNFNNLNKTLHTTKYSIDNSHYLDNKMKLKMSEVDNESSNTLNTSRRSLNLSIYKTSNRASLKSIEEIHKEIEIKKEKNRKFFEELKKKNEDEKKKDTETEKLKLAMLHSQMKQSLEKISQNKILNNPDNYRISNSSDLKLMLCSTKKPIHYEKNLSFEINNKSEIKDFNISNNENNINNINNIKDSNENKLNVFGNSLNTKNLSFGLVNKIELKLDQPLDSNNSKEKSKIEENLKKEENKGPKTLNIFGTFPTSNSLNNLNKDNESKNVFESISSEKSENKELSGSSKNVFSLNTNIPTNNFFTNLNKSSPEKIESDNEKGKINENSTSPFTLNKKIDIELEDKKDTDKPVLFSNIFNKSEANNTINTINTINTNNSTVFSGLFNKDKENEKESSDTENKNKNGSEANSLFKNLKTGNTEIVLGNESSIASGFLKNNKTDTEKENEEKVSENKLGSLFSNIADKKLINSENNSTENKGFGLFNQNKSSLEPSSTNEIFKNEKENVKLGLFASTELENKSDKIENKTPSLFTNNFEKKSLFTTNNEDKKDEQKSNSFLNSIESNEYSPINMKIDNSKPTLDLSKIKKDENKEIKDTNDIKDTKENKLILSIFQNKENESNKSNNIFSSEPKNQDELKNNSATDSNKEKTNPFDIRNLSNKTETMNQNLTKTNPFNVNSNPNISSTNNISNNPFSSVLPSASQTLNMNSGLSTTNNTMLGNNNSSIFGNQLFQNSSFGSNNNTNNSFMNASASGNSGLFNNINTNNPSNLFSGNNSNTGGLLSNNTSMNLMNQNSNNSLFSNQNHNFSNLNSNTNANTNSSLFQNAINSNTNTNNSGSMMFNNNMGNMGNMGFENNLTNGGNNVSNIFGITNTPNNTTPNLFNNNNTNNSNTNLFSQFSNNNSGSGLFSNIPTNNLLGGGGGGGVRNFYF